MSEEQKPAVEVPQVKPDTEPAVAAEPAPAVDAAKPADETKPAEAADETKPAEAADETKPAEAADAAVNTDLNKDASKPVEEGHLAHKDQGASFPKNLIPSKEFFFFGSNAFEPKALAQYQKSEKSAETAHENLAWASHTGKGLLFTGDKKAPTSVINLAHASEPEIDGSNKFHFTTKGNKHSFKAASTPERDSWVTQLKLKIAEAKELAATVTESEAYIKTIESLKPAAKEEKPAENAPKTEEAAKEEKPAENAPKTEEAAKEEAKDEDPKRRSASRKRASFFNFGGKKEDKKDERKSEDALAAAAAAAPETDEAPVVADAPAVVAEDKPAEKIPAESPKEKLAPSKRNSFFGNVFSKKEKKPIETTKTAEEAPVAAPENEVTTTDAVAPVIPPVESTTPLAVDVSNPATVPTETVETSANGEVKKDVKEKRKSSLPFAFGKRDKSPVPAENEEKSGKSAFSKFRATIKGKSAAKAEDKSVEEMANESAATEPAKEASTAEGAAKEANTAREASTAAQAEAENKPDNVAASTPAVTAAA